MSLTSLEVHEVDYSESEAISLLEEASLSETEISEYFKVVQDFFRVRVEMIEKLWKKLNWKWVYFK